MASATEKEFFDHEINNGITPENPDYFLLMDSTANIIKNYARNIIEIGAGLGTLGECLIHKGCDYYGIEPNKYHREFAKSRGVELYDLGNYPSHTQMIVSIEVLEHLTDEQINEYLESIEADYFYLSSTPYTTTEEFDTWWGHINIKQVDEWIEFFAEYGYSVHKRLSIPTEWSILFKK
jgi:2-polyprenyl-3-methyl-5-hydroxy-6-metoxy-1,4-benzoquinol methylase